jgi:hypothetical protein
MRRALLLGWVENSHLSLWGEEDAVSEDWRSKACWRRKSSCEGLSRHSASRLAEAH